MQIIQQILFIILVFFAVWLFAKNIKKIRRKILLIRRNILKLKRFRSHELDGWPRSDANYILITEILLMTLFLTMNTTDRALQLIPSEHYHETGNFVVSGM